MTVKENEASSTMLSEDPKKDPFSGITDSKFKAFIEGAYANFVPAGDGRFEVLRSMEYVVEAVYPDVKSFSTKGIATRLIQRLIILKKEKILKTDRVDPGDGRTGIEVADSENLILAMGYLYARKELDSVPRKKGEESSDTVRYLGKLKELWGNNPRAQEAGAVIDELNKKTAKRAEEKDAKNRTSAIKASLKIPEQIPQLKEIDAQALFEKMEALKARFSSGNISGNDVYVTAEETGLLLESLKTVEFVDCFDRQEMAYYYPERDKFLLIDLLRQMKHSILVMVSLEKRARKDFGSGAKLRRANLNDLYVVRRGKILAEEKNR